MVRITQGVLIRSFLAHMSTIDRNLVELQRQISTGKAFERPGEDPVGASQVMNIDVLIEHLTQYRENMNDGRSRLSYVDENLRAVGDYMHRARELTVQGANSYLTAADRGAISQEIDQIIRGIVALGNADYNARYLYAGYQTLKQPFEIVFDSSGKFVTDVMYKGDLGTIARNIGSFTDIDVNFTGKELFLEMTERLRGRAVTGAALNYSGSFRINGVNVTVNQVDTLVDIRDRINSTADIGVRAIIDQNFVLTLDSLSAVGEIRLEDTAGSILEDLGLILKGAFNIGTAPPLLPLIDSQGAIKTGSLLPDFPSPPGLGITIDGTNDRLVLRLGPSANNGETTRKSVQLVQGNYATITELVEMIEERIVLEFGVKKILVRENAGAIELETYESGSSVLLQDLVVGGLDPQGNADTASVTLGLTAAGGPENADSDGTDGNDKFSIDLGVSAHPDGIDLDPVLIDIDADSALTLTALVASINDSIRSSDLNGLIEAKEFNGRLMFETLKTGVDVLGGDLSFSDVTAGTLAALNIVNAPTPARVPGTAPFPPGVTITFGVNDSFSIDLGPAASGDWSDPDPQIITVPAAVYASAAALASAINGEILSNSVLINNVEAAVFSAGGFDFIEIRTLATGSGVDAADLFLADDVPGTLANLGLAGPTIPGGGSADGQGEMTESGNLFASLITLRDDLNTVAGGESRLVDLESFKTDKHLSLAPGDRIEINAGGNSIDILVRSYTTLEDLAGEISKFLGIGVEVTVTGDGRIFLENISNQPIVSFSIKAFNPLGKERSAFDEAFARLEGTILPKSSVHSAFLRDFERLDDVSLERLGEVERDRLNVLDFRARGGSSIRRLEFALDQSEAFEIQLRELKLSIEGVDMAEVITRFKMEENILRATLSTGARVIQPSLFDFLR